MGPRRGGVVAGRQVARLRGESPARRRLPRHGERSLAHSLDGRRAAKSHARGVKNIHVWTDSAQGGHARNLTPDFDRTGLDLMATDLRDFHEAGPPVWSADGGTIYYLVCDEGST